MITQLFLILLLIMIAVMTESIIGFGTGSISLPVLSIFYPIHQVILFIGIIHFIGNIWKLHFFKTGCKWKLIATFGIPAAIASIIGAYTTFHIPETYVYKILGVMLISYSSFFFLNGNISLPKNNILLISGGSISGFFSGIIGLGGPIRATLLHSLNLPKLTFIFTASFISFFIDISRLTTYFLQGSRLTLMFWIGIAAYLPISFLGIFIAKKFVNFIPQDKFRILVTIFLAIFGIYLLIR